MAFKSWLAEAGCYDEVKVNHKSIRTSVKPIHRKPTTHVSMVGGYTPAEEKAMQERKVALIEQHNAQLEAIKGNTERTSQHVGAQIAQVELLRNEVRDIALAISALSNVLQVLVAQAVPAKRTRKPYEKAPEGLQEPVAAIPSGTLGPAPEALAGVLAEVEKKQLAQAPTFVEAAKALQPVLEKANAQQEAAPPVKTGVVHESIKRSTIVDSILAEEKALAQAKAPPTLDELRTTFPDYIAKNGREEGIKKLQSFGITKLGELPANEYGAFKSLLA